MSESGDMTENVYDDDDDDYYQNMASGGRMGEGVADDSQPIHDEDAHDYHVRLAAAAENDNDDQEGNVNYNAGPPVAKPRTRGKYKGQIHICDQKKLWDICNTGNVKRDKWVFKPRPHPPPKPLQRPYQAIGVRIPGKCEEECQRTQCENEMKRHHLDLAVSRPKTPYYAYHSRMAPCINYGQHSSVFGWYMGQSYENHADVGRYNMPWRTNMKKDGDKYGVRRNLLRNAKEGNLPQDEHDTPLFMNRTEQIKYNVEDKKRVAGKVKYPTYADAAQLIFPPLHSNRSKYQITQRKAMGKVLSRPQYPNVFHKKLLLECLADCPDLPADQRPA